MQALKKLRFFIEGKIYTSRSWGLDFYARSIGRKLWFG